MLLLSSVWNTPAFAQDGGVNDDTPRIKPVRISQTEKPDIDGDLSDPVWAKAALIDEFYQVEPSIAPPEVRTEVRLAYDEDALYIAVTAFEPEMNSIYATIMERDGDVWRDDMIRFYIDPFDTGISGFGFDVNALGARADRLLQPGRRPIDEWDTIWNAAAKMLDDRWTAEISIPFRSISFDPGSDGWGLILTRERSYKAQEYRWSGINQSLNTFNFQGAGRLEGIENVNRGNGVELVLQGTAAASRDWITPRDDDLTFDPSASLLYKFTPSLSGLLTFNSDFSDTPLDTREVNTGRFSLFFPETRDFFLQNAAFFEFGGQAFNQAPNGRPFFSRRIGIVNGQQVTLRGGAKLSGELAGIQIGALAANMGEASGVEPQTLSVLRAAYDVSKSSRIGAMITHGDPTGRSDNTLFGVDYLFQTPSIWGAGRLESDIYYQRSLSSVVDDDESFGARLAYPNDRWNWTLAFREIGENFRPALGFVNRPASRSFTGSWHRRFRRKEAGTLNWWQLGTEHEFVTDLNGELETRETALVGKLQTRGTDELTVTVFENFENVILPFNLPTALTVTPGEYQNDGVRLRFQSSLFRPIGANVTIEARDFFGGESLLFDVDGLFRPNRFIDIRASYERRDISVPAGDVIVNIGSLDTVFNVSPKLSFSTQTQYDNISNGLSFFGRARWELRPETEVFVSLGHGAIIPDGDFGRNFRSIQTQAVFRIGNTFRF